MGRPVGRPARPKKRGGGARAQHNATVPHAVPAHTLVHVHLAATLADDAHDAWVRNRRLDPQRQQVQLLHPTPPREKKTATAAGRHSFPSALSARKDELSRHAWRPSRVPTTDLELFVVAHGRVHLNLEGVNLEELRALFGVVFTRLGAACVVQHLEDLGQARELASVQPQFGELEVGFEPQPLSSSPPPGAGHGVFRAREAEAAAVSLRPTSARAASPARGRAPHLVLRVLERL